MTTKTQTLLFASIMAALLIPFVGMQEAEALAVPVFNGGPGGLVVTWSGTVEHGTSQSEYANTANMCGESFTAAGFYDTAYNKRGASHYALWSFFMGISLTLSEVSELIRPMKT